MSRVFVSHASEDKDEVARPMSCLLAAQGHSVWFDEFSLDIGCSLRESIDQGLAHSDFGVVVLSSAFFAKDWPKDELDGLLAIEKMHSRNSTKKRKRIFPVWHNLGSKDVETFSPVLAGRLGIPTSIGLASVVKAIADSIDSKRELDGYVSAAHIAERFDSKFLHYKSPLGGEFIGCIFANTDRPIDTIEFPKHLPKERLDELTKALDGVLNEKTHLKKNGD